jgi:hypothetical protein
MSVISPDASFPVAVDNLAQEVQEMQQPGRDSVASPGHRAEDVSAIQGNLSSVEAECTKQGVIQSHAPEERAEDEDREEEKKDSGGKEAPAVIVTLSGLTKVVNRSRTHKELQQRKQRTCLAQPRVLLPDFKETPPHCVGQALQDIIDHINPCGDSCCSWHIAIASVSAVLMEMKHGACLPEYKPVSEWQCGHCSFMQDDSVDSYAVEDQGGYCWNCGCENK